MSAESIAVPYQTSGDERIQWIHARVDDVKGKNVIDLGCGSGFVCEELVKAGAATVYGCDIVPVTPGAGWQFASCDLSHQDWADQLMGERHDTQAFHLITAFDIIEHLHNPVAFLQECSRLMGPDSKLVLTTPNTGSWERYLRPQNWSGVTDPQHYIIFNRYSLQFLLHKCGFKVEALEAPIRALGPLNAVFPGWGGQIMVCASKRA